MDSDRRQHQESESVSYSTLFNLEPLMSCRLLQRDDDFDYHGSSSQEGSRDSPDGATGWHSNGVIPEKDSKVSKRKRRPSNGDIKDEDGYYGRHIMEEHYRAMLGEHVKKYKRRSKDTSSAAAAKVGLGMALMAARNLGSGNNTMKDQRRGSRPEWLGNGNPHKLENFHEADFIRMRSVERVAYEPAFLDITDGLTYKIPPTYDMLQESLNLPSFFDVTVDEFQLKGSLDFVSLAKLLATDKRLGPRHSTGMGEPRPQYESLQERLKLSNPSQKFDLKVSDLHSLIPEGAAGNIKRYILSEGGVLQVYYVKVLEKGDAYEIIERSLPKKPQMVEDPALIEKEERENIGQAWVNIVRRDMPKHYRMFTNFHRKQLIDAKRFSEYCQREVKMKVTRSLKIMRGAAIRTRKLARDMLLFWKRVDKEMAEVRKKEEREAAEALKREQELREQKRQQQRLNFLIQQTELYGHFMQNKSNSQQPEAPCMGDEKETHQEAVRSSPGPSEEEDPEEAELKKEALKAAQNAVSKQKKLTTAFDTECMRLRQAADSEVPPNESLIEGSRNIDLQTPSTMPTTSTVQTPELFKGSLKEYQLKGLQWLVNCYEQGLNGILADEMGLGKTIQAMAFLAHLAEEKNIWGPFLVVAPASVLNNWADEISRFCPDLKTLPYWGGLQERTVLRKNINPKRLYRRDAAFHILITSYQLLVSDEKYFRRVKWQYMVLDEAQAIKSSSSIRWKTLLSFNCRNRLLLTGTPIQNNMAELWALLHFIMPTLFDSHEQFNEWFSKGIESHAEHGGTLNEHQLNRLHAILKPFMLRRVKKDVISELTRKTEITVHCKLSSRQQAFYQAIKDKISLTELFDGSHGHLSEKKILNLMNIVIQLRKVCNHPELFERNEGRTYFHFGEVPHPLSPPPFGELEDVYYSGGQNPITYKIPKLVYEEIIHASEMLSTSIKHGSCREAIWKIFSIFSSDNVHKSVYGQSSKMQGQSIRSGTFGFTHLIDLSPLEVSFLAAGSFMEKLLFTMMRLDRHFPDNILDFLVEATEDSCSSNLDSCKVRAVTKMLLMPSRIRASLFTRKLATGPDDDPFEALVCSNQDRILSNIKLLHSTHMFIPRARAPPISAVCSDRDFIYKTFEDFHHPWIKRLFVGFARTSEFNGPRMPAGPPHPLIEEIDTQLPISQPALQFTYRMFGSCPPMQSFDPSKLLTDSGKLQTLDILLKRLHAENHRVLLFAQMTKMLNILEDYMNHRKYRYLRLDGSSTIMDRRDMVRDFQHRSDVFVFLLSTRAGGLGINLTAADTVIFYESDWNPTLDLQAMDRAHRLGQTKDVTVYRLICKETVEEKILQRASQKSTVQQLVMTGGHVQGDLLAPEDVVSLLLDDAQLEQKLKETPQQAKDRQKRKPQARGIRVDAEGDASLEDLANTGGDGVENEPDLDADKSKSSSRSKRKSTSDSKSLQSMTNSQKVGDHRSPVVDYELDEVLEQDEEQSSKLKKLKRPKKSVNDIEPAFTVVSALPQGQMNYTV
ncbi:hypothetical protein MLD38_004465 [Melastoma candidum]|uniref:Uncharacterized protein n=1 Tax=Melastoma candidum TaxID=119954 RepID=A0ACB9SAF6_9MYRT|nr:hypothetical protein MLD38_004465 [Melastoma candidum]